MTAALIAIMLMVGGGTSYMAEGAVPGDLLYPVKIEVNENVKSVLAFSNEAEAKLQAELVAERLEEAEKLALRGELNAAVTADIQNRVKAHYLEAERRSGQAQMKGKYEVSAYVRASLEGTFRMYEEILADLNSRVKGNDSESLIADIHMYAEATAEARAEAIVNIQTVVAAKIAKEATTATIQQTDDLILAVQGKLPEANGRVSLAAQAQIDEKLAAAISSQTKAKASLATESYRDAYTDSGLAMQAAHETAIMIDSLLKLQLDQESTTKSNVGVTSDTAADADLDTSTSTDTMFASSTPTQAEEGTTTATTTDGALEIDAAIDTSLDTNLDSNSLEENTSTTASVQSGLSL